MSATRETMIFAKLLERVEMGDEDYDDFFLECRILGMTTRVIGMSSQIYDSMGNETGKHIFMMDTKPLDEHELEHLMNRLYNTCHHDHKIVVVIRSSKRKSGIHSYHVIMPHPHTPYQIREICLGVFKPFVDILFLGLGEYRKMWDLRISSKGKGDGDSPTLVRLFQPEVNINIVSLSHLYIMHKYLKMDFPYCPNQIDNRDSMNKILLRYSVTP